MDFVAALVALLVSLPAYYQDKETSAERAARMQVVAVAIADAAQTATCSGRYEATSCKAIWPGSDQELALLLVTKGWWESRFAKHVQAGQCGPRECDAYRDRAGKIVHRSASYWQVQASSLLPPAQWRKTVGLDLAATRRAAWAAARIASGARGRCTAIGGSWEYGTISAYASGYTCAWRGAPRRVAFLRRLRVQFGRILSQQAVRPAKATGQAVKLAPAQL